MSLVELWNQVREDLIERTESNYAGMTYARLRLVSCGEAGIVLEGELPDLMLPWFLKQHLPEIAAALTRLAGFPVSVVFAGQEETLKVTAKKRHKTVDAVESRSLMPVETRLLPGQSFDSFISSPDNLMAWQTSRQVAELPGQVANPLFLYGATGSGKTHLLNAIVGHFRQGYPKGLCALITAEDFVNNFIDATRNKTHPKFRASMRGLDLLLIDDIQFLQGKERTQEEFFHTFNTLIQAGKQIVLTSDKTPNELQGLEQRLVSRFESGQICDLHYPDADTRFKILVAKQTRQKIQLSKELLQWAAVRIEGNVRRLEGALLRLVSYTSLSVKEPSLVEAERLLVKHLPPPLPHISLGPTQRIAEIQKTVAHDYGVTLKDLLGSSRANNIALPRQVAMTLCRDLTQSSLPALGEAFKRNHSTVLHAIQSLSTRRLQDAELDGSLVRIRAKLEKSFAGQ